MRINFKGVKNLVSRIQGGIEGFWKQGENTFTRKSECDRWLEKMT